jgi:hypothetical protein
MQRSPLTRRSNKGQTAYRLSKSEDAADVKSHTVQTLEQAFAQMRFSYAFEQEGWKLVITDLERPDCSPDPNAI